MDIKVGEYVRTECGIAKVKNIEITDEVYELDKDIMYVHQENWKSTCSKSEIVKHSKNIIDLIEVGDIVEYQVNSLSELKVGRVKSYRDARSNKEYLGVEGFDITKIYIKSILTNKQFEENCYKVR